MKTRGFMRGITAGVAALTLLGNAALAAEGALSVKREVELRAPPSMVAPLVASYAGLHAWHPAIVGTELTGNGKTAGDIRVLILGDGAKIKEELVAANASSYTYVILESPLPLTNYKATVAVHRTKGGMSHVSWSSTFDANGVPDDDVVNLMGGIYDAGMQALAERYQ